jgi:CubicO group peptidase (beta-lactamase class C family)/D-alanyl-D-alanine dipeptidase
MSSSHTVQPQPCAWHRRLQLPAIWLLLCISCQVCSPAHATEGSLQQAGTATSEAAIARITDAIRFEMAARDLPALSIAVVDRDNTLWQAGFGFTDSSRTSPATAGTIYRVGSISKLLTDIAVMQLVASGELQLDAAAAELLPSFHLRDHAHRQITLRQLMSHRSGLVREPPVGNYFDPSEPTLSDTVASLNNTRLVYPPGSRVKYSNAAVAVVGAILARQTGQEFSDQMQTSVLDPLRMTNSSFDTDSPIGQQVATGWMWTYDGRRFEAPTWSLGTTPAGNLYSNVSDLANLLRCVLNKGNFDEQQILAAEALAQMTTPEKASDGQPLPFGIGFHIGQLDGRKMVGHGGAVYGFSSQVEVLPDAGLGVAIVCALDGSNGLVRRLTDYSLRCMLAVRQHQPLPEYVTTDPLPPERAHDLQGTYAADGRLVQITLSHDRAWLRDGTLRVELRSRASDGAIITNDVLGGTIGVRLNAADQLVLGDTTLHRVPESIPESAPVAWREIIGEYGTDDNVLYLLEDHGRLTALIEWFYYYPLTKIAADRYAFPDYGLYHGEHLQVERDSSGKVLRVVAAEVPFIRREVGTRDGETFRITPVRPIEELRREALSAEPPAENGKFLPTDLVDLTSLDPSIRLDIRYATTNNFTGAVFYQQPRALMQRRAAEAVVAAHRSLAPRGLGLLIHDAYRPWHVTRMFWDATPESMKDFVADPEQGSRHNRGCAVDLTLCELQTGKPLEMVAGYDEFSPRSFPDYPGGTTRQRYFRQLLWRTMSAHGFRVYEYEWWHFDYRDWKSYRIGNQTFEEIPTPDQAAVDSSASQIDALHLEHTTIPLRRNGREQPYDGQRCWVHARAGTVAMPGRQTPSVVLTTQQLQLTGSDVFYALHAQLTDDLGANWSDLIPQQPFRRQRIDERTELTVCDFVPQWHANSKTLLGIGQTVWYRDNKVMPVRDRSTAYSTWDEARRAWRPWRRLTMPDEPRFANSGAGSVQRVDLPDGDILLPLSFKEPGTKQYSTTVCRCHFDGTALSYAEHGTEMTISAGRGLYEPSLAYCNETYFLTLRNDAHGYVTSSSDGLNYSTPKVWTFDDGADLGNYNTQQHWITHEDRLYLVYTRRGADNDHVFRHRAPLFIAEVDPARLVVLRGTEQVLIPERGARLGNFGVCRISDDEVWVTAAEWMQGPPPTRVIPVDNPRGANNAIHLAKLKW